MAEDSLQCLEAIGGGSADGVHYLIKHQSLVALAQAYLAQNNGKWKKESELSKVSCFFRQFIWILVYKAAPLSCLFSIRGGVS